MKKLLFLLLISTVVLSLPGCFADTGKVALGEEFELRIGESAAIRGEDFEITFLEVLEDSRCPKNVTCVWEGRARSLVRITVNGISEKVELTEPGLSDEANLYRYGSYRITYYLLPYPENAVSSYRDEYYLRLTVSR